MTRRLGLVRSTHLLSAVLVAALVLTAASASAQVGPWRESTTQPPRAAAPQPDQPVVPAVPTIERRAPAPPQPQAPFTLAPQEQAEVDRVLDLWEKRSAAVKTFECRFKRWEYDPTFGKADEARFIDLGVLKYAAPDRGAFQVSETVINDKPQEIDPNRAEHWICDGKAIYEYKPQQKQMAVYPLPPQLQGKAIANSPLPFLFGSKAEDLRRRYWVRLVTPRDVQNNETWLQAFPRFQEDAANFSEAVLILTNQNMQPNAMRVVAPNRKNKTTYSFFDTVVNDPLRFFKGDPFQASLPLGWQKVVNNPQPAAQPLTPAYPPQSANRPQPPGTR